MIKAAIYTRVSTRDKGQTTANQIPSLQDHCSRQGWLVVQVLEEEQSAGTGKKRPYLETLLGMVRRKEIQVVLVYKLDRLARSLNDFVEIVNILDRFGCRLVIPGQGIDTDSKSATGKLMMSLLAVFAEFERDLIRDRVKAGIERVRSKGKKWGREEIQVDREQVRKLMEEGVGSRRIGEIVGVGKNKVCKIMKEIREREREGEKGK